MVISNELLPSRKRRIAAIDVGTNSVHLLVAEVDDLNNIQIIETAKDQIRLGEALDERLLLDADALTKAASTLRRLREIADAHNAVVRAVGTHALREAKNGREFCARLFKRCGVNVEIISGNEEARLVSLGVEYGLPISAQPTLIADIGGGSTEFWAGQWGEERFSTSLKLGAVRLTKKYIQSDPVNDADLESLKTYILTRLQPVLAEICKVGFENAVGTSGTAKAIKAVALGLQDKAMPESLHGAYLSSAEVTLVKNAIEGARSLKERKSLPNMDPKRADILLAGVLVLDTITRLGEIEKWTLSLTGLREGIVLDSLTRSHQWLRGDPSDIRWRSVRSLGRKFEVDEVHAWHITTLALSLFDQLSTRHGLDISWREYLRSAAYTHECGRYLSYTGYHKHGFYLLRNSDLGGFTTHEQDFIASIVRYHRKRLPKENDEVFCDFEAKDQKAVDVCASLLRLAVSLDRGRKGKIQDVRVVDEGRKICLHLHLRGSNHDIGLELYQTGLEKEHFERMFDVTLQLESSER